MGYGRYAQEFLANWREYDGPTGKKVLLTVKNRSRAFKRLVTEGNSCCGNHGEPGC